ncbi:hypothetical protein GCM10010435_53460 [Winogradskya consettensis]|uniref:Uncharacterized protein n=1 Tax=Winogradskya consettensis TaxID=113560 RepID=A0A919SH48_9ACTN|nr:hypothetical protein [Actinoplanes consettensis]GIM71579.1 hypothetical protein Aco04nite_25980 [Actinoplanes consettensis]
MTPEEHAGQAEELLAAATKQLRIWSGAVIPSDISPEQVARAHALAALAQVHATLALVQGDSGIVSGAGSAPGS